MGTFVDDTADVWDLVVALLYQSWPLQVTKQQRDAQSWLCYEGVDSTRSAGRQWDPFLGDGSDWIRGHGGSRAEEEEVIPLFFRASEM